MTEIIYYNADHSGRVIAHTEELQLKFRVEELIESGRVIPIWEKVHETNEREDAFDACDGLIELRKTEGNYL